MDGLKAYRYYIGIKLHFTNPKFNVFVNRGRIKGSQEAFLKRNDRGIFEKLARQFNDKDYIQYIASNFMYGNSDVIYNSDDAQTNYKEFLRRRQSITRIFTDDLHIIVDSGTNYYDFSGQNVPDILQLYLGKKITLETMVILNDMDQIIDKLMQSNIALMLGDELLRITKSKGFVKYDSYKIMGTYQQFLEEIKSAA